MLVSFIWNIHAEVFIETYDGVATASEGLHSGSVASSTGIELSFYRKSVTVKLKSCHVGKAVVDDDLRWSYHGISFCFSEFTLNPENNSKFMLVASENLAVPASLDGITFKKNGTSLNVQQYRVDQNKLYITFGEQVDYNLATYDVVFAPTLSNIKNTNGDVLINQPNLSQSTYEFGLLPGKTKETYPQSWRGENDVINGWDWSLPSNIKVSENASVLGSIKMPCTQLESLSFSWKQLETQEGVYNFQPLIEEIKKCKEQGHKSQVHIKASVIQTNYYYDDGRIKEQPGTAPDWLKNYVITKKMGSRHDGVYPNFQIYNYDIYNPLYITHYNRFLEALGETGALKSECIKTIYMHGVSGSRGEEVDEPSDMNSAEGLAWKSIMHTWKKALGDQIGKLAYAGRWNNWLSYAFDLGLGQRGGFVEMYLRDVETPNLGCTIDTSGYLLFNDDLAPVKEARTWGDENEEYGDNLKGRYGDPKLYAHRFRESWFRALQMRRISLWTGSHTYYPEFSYWCGMELGRKATDSPDAWSYLRESYLQNKKTMKNFERWVFQRDLPGYPTQAVNRFDHGYNAVNADPDRRFDMVGRKGKMFGFGVDDNFIAPRVGAKVTIKLTYMDKGIGSLRLRYSKDGKEMSESINKTNSGKIKTATFFINNAMFNATGYNPDFFVDGEGKEVELFFVRVVKTEKLLHKYEQA